MSDPICVTDNNHSTINTNNNSDGTSVNTVVLHVADQPNTNGQSSDDTKGATSKTVVAGSQPSLSSSVKNTEKVDIPMSFRVFNKIHPFLISPLVLAANLLLLNSFSFMDGTIYKVVVYLYGIIFGCVFSIVMLAMSFIDSKRGRVPISISFEYVSCCMLLVYEIVVCVFSQSDVNYLAGKSDSKSIKKPMVDPNMLFGIIIATLFLYVVWCKIIRAKLCPSYQAYVENYHKTNAPSFEMFNFEGGFCAYF
jgi:NADH:ubiquinone oxidoreductase subunit 6 (subunit J)